MVKIEFDHNKAASNLVKHRISFEEAIQSLNDPLAVVLPDPDSIDEERYLLLGNSQRSRILLVVYAYQQGDTIRIISARKATSREKQEYERRIRL